MRKDNLQQLRKEARWEFDREFDEIRKKVIGYYDQDIPPEVPKEIKDFIDSLVIRAYKEGLERALATIEKIDIGEQSDCRCYEYTCVPCMVWLEKNRRKDESLIAIRKEINKLTK